MSLPCSKAGTENENLRMARAEKAEKPARARAAAAEAAAAEAERKTSKLAGTPGKEQVPCGRTLVDIHETTRCMRAPASSMAARWL